VFKEMLGEEGERKEEGSAGAGGPGALGAKPIKVSAELFSKSKHAPVGLKGLGEQAVSGDRLAAAQPSDLLAEISSDDSRKSLNTLYLSLSVTHTLDLEG
jgi:hypothetical protein